MWVSWGTWAISTTPIREIQRWFQASWRIISLHCVLGLPRAQNIPQGGVLTSFPKCFNWILSMWSSGSALISFWDLYGWPKTPFRENSFLVTCIPDPDARRSLNVDWLWNREPCSPLSLHHSGPALIRLSVFRSIFPPLENKILNSTYYQLIRPQVASLFISEMCGSSPSLCSSKSSVFWSHFS